MDDDWDDGSMACQTESYLGLASDGSRKFTSGRGFSAIKADENDEYGNSNQNKGETTDSGWNDTPLTGTSDNRRGARGGGRGDFRGGRGEGRGGRGEGRGGRGGRRGGGNAFGGDFQDDNGFGGGKDSGWGDSADTNNGDGWGGDGERRGRGGRGGGRGRGRGGGSPNGFESKPSEENDDKPKEIYVPVERVTDEELFANTITSGINFMKLENIEVNASGDDVPSPIISFESSGLRPLMLENIKKSGYTKPTPIQKYAIPIVMKGRDLMGCAQTGSGKTAAFLLPIINHLIANKDAPITEGSTAQPKVIIVSPTRELTIQIYEQAKKFAYNSIVKTVVAYGGTSVLHQRNQILNGCHILVATPGRLNDFVKRKHISFASVEFFVLDEADRMLDMGFLPTVEEMLGDSTMVATGERQTLMFSATFPEQIQHLAGKFLHNYIFVAVGIVGSASTDVEQNVHQVTKFQKREKLLEILKKESCQTLVFVETKRNADFLATYLCENDMKTTSIHGDRLQREREQALWDFKKKICPTLVATGVAARGLDIQGIQHVINYDLPKSIDEYVHRIGRTGRVGNRGKATSFFDPSCDGPVAGDLARILKQAGQEVPNWLSSGAFSSYENDSFGGVDIRGDDFGRAQNLSVNPAEEVEESW